VIAKNAGILLQTPVTKYKKSREILKM